MTIKSKLTIKQVKKFTRVIGKETLKLEISYDDECGNGHNSFHMTGDLWETAPNGRKVHIAGGCVHDEIKRFFPEYAKYIKWHFMNSDGPMHYPGNATYHAGNRDYNGLLEGEPHTLHDATYVKFGEHPIPYKPKDQKFVKWLQECKGSYDFEVIGIDHKERETYGTHYTFGGYGETWYDCPFRDEQHALQVLEALQSHNPTFISEHTSWGKGKERDFKGARSCAIWPRATEAQLSLPKEELEKLLLARLPQLIKSFQKDLKELNLIY